MALYIWYKKELKFIGTYKCTTKQAANNSIKSRMGSLHFLLLLFFKDGELCCPSGALKTSLSTFKYNFN